MDPFDLDVRLHDVIDADAIEALAAHDGGAWRLTFVVADREVTVDSDGSVVVDGRVFPDSFEIR